MSAVEPPAKIGPYRIEERLGAGGMGTVYRAYDERLRRRVALKQIHPERSGRPGARERFLREARAVARLNHAALVHLHDFLETDDGDWIVMELVEGPPLARLLDAGPFDLGPALVLARDIAGGLAVAHAAGILHRDLKTENVVVTRDGRAKLLDFGLAASMESAAEARDEREDAGNTAALTGDGQIVGTPRAMSPEQILGREVDARSDLFSFGVLLYETTTGVSPFLGPGPAETLARVCHHEPDPARKHAPDLSRELSDLIDRLLRKDPAARLRSAAEVAEVLEQIHRDTRREEPRPVEVAAPVAPAVAEPSEDDREPFHFRGERRQVSVLCCELAGASLDPEVLFEVLPPFQAVVKEAIERYEGHLRDIQGHRLVACFGYPHSHEDNARRAVLTALRIAERTAPAVQGFQARAGVHTGPAVILHRAAGEHLALGETLDLATFLQERAAPGHVLLSGQAHRLVAGFFEQEEVAAVRIEAFRAMAARQVHDRVAAAEHLTPFVGRERELKLLIGRFELAREGVGQTVLVAGEAGVGKSRLLCELRERSSASEGHCPPRGSEGGEHWVPAYGSPYARNLPLHPLGGFVRRLLRIDENATAEEQRSRLEESLAEYGFPIAEAMPLFATLLGLPGGGLELSRLRLEMLEAFPALLQEAAERRPLVVTFEDLHQVDSTTLELLGRVIDETAHSPVLLVLSCRPEFRPPWGSRAQMTQLRLAPLDPGETSELVDALAAGRELSPAARARIVARAAGIPLFAEELVRAAPVEETQRDDAVPVALRDFLAVRLDRLGEARELARVLAGLGREVSRADLATAAALDEETFTHQLDHLLAADVLVERGMGYRFRHDLVREAAAASVLAEDLDSLLSS